jgi:hypothetical protein
MQSPFDSRTVVETEFADGFCDEIDIVLRHDDVLHPVHAVHIASLGGAAVIENDLDEAIRPVRLFEALANYTGENF